MSVCPFLKPRRSRYDSKQQHLEAFELYALAELACQRGATADEVYSALEGVGGWGGGLLDLRAGAKKEAM